MKYVVSLLPAIIGYYDQQYRKLKGKYKISTELITITVLEMQIRNGDCLFYTHNKYSDVIFSRLELALLTLLVITLTLAQHCHW